MPPARHRPRPRRPALPIRPARPGRLSVALLPALLAACATPPPEPPLPYPPSVRERILRLAWAEWAEWGRISRDPLHRPPRQADAPRPESAIENFPRLVAYWSAVPEDEGAVRDNRALYAATLAGDAAARPWAEPAWSAAFISYLMRAAGVDRREFPPAAAHGSYIDALVADALAFPATAPFLPREPATYAPRVGDLVCADRSARPIRDWRERAADRGRFRPLHCDLVVELGAGVAAAIGGNVGDAVTLTRFPTDAGGVLLPLPAEAPVWFAVFENRLGLLPPWGSPGVSPGGSAPPTAAGIPLARTASGSPPS